jgi:16S rRNA (guanine527-N7)-methyltransferase
MADETEDRREALRLVPVSRETEERLSLYADRLKRWQAIKNLVGPATLPELWTRHIADSAQLLAHAPAARRWVDLGSGAGFPGLVIAILLADVPEARVDLIEANNRKCAFLREVARDTGACAVVHTGRIEDVVPTLSGPVDVVTARALASVERLLDLGRPLFDQGALGLFLTGEGGAEVSEPGWQLDTAPSKTHPAARILMVRRSGSWDNGA